MIVSLPDARRRRGGTALRTLAMDLPSAELQKNSLVIMPCGRQSLLQQPRRSNPHQ